MDTNKHESEKRFYAKDANFHEFQKLNESARICVIRAKVFPVSP